MEKSGVTVYSARVRRDKRFRSGKKERRIMRKHPLEASEADVTPIVLNLMNGSVCK